ncbi:hypothetical protein [Rhodobacter sp. NSM]|uniref:hypothetical protein n=1 Tax=Rhodobacter sp. NSM TaxID=3457501 RepID=UPI003FD4797C
MPTVGPPHGDAAARFRRPVRRHVPNARLPSCDEGSDGGGRSPDALIGGILRKPAMTRRFHHQTGNTRYTQEVHHHAEMQP